MTICYAVKDNLYLNITNKCPCACTFCIRQNADGAYGSDSLWLEHEPTRDEIIADIDKFLGAENSYGEVVFCGYGEPMERVTDVAYISKYIKGKYGVKIRLNTNGLGDKIHGIDTARLLDGVVDIVSISLNSGTKDGYNAVTRPKWDDAFDAMLKFAVDCKKYVPKVMFTVVDVISKDDIDKCKVISERLDIPLRVRTYDT